MHVHLLCSYKRRSRNQHCISVSFKLTQRVFYSLICTSHSIVASVLCGNADGNGKHYIRHLNSQHILLSLPCCIHPYIYVWPWIIHVNYDFVQNNNVLMYYTLTQHNQENFKQRLFVVNRTNWKWDLGSNFESVQLIVVDLLFWFVHESQKNNFSD